MKLQVRIKILSLEPNYNLEIGTKSKFVEEV